MIRGEVIGGEELVQRVGLFGPKLRGGLEQSIARLTANLLTRAKLKVNGPASGGLPAGVVLHKKSGRLGRSINQRIEGKGTPTVAGIVGTNLAYGKVHEFGGPVTVRAHQRMMTKAWGRPVKNPRQIEVREHIAKYPERSFLRSALAEMAPAIQAELERGVREAIK